MSQTSVKARLTKGLQVLTANQTVVMSFKMQTGKDEHLAMPVNAIPDIVERLIVAHNNAKGQTKMLYFGTRDVAPGTAPSAAAEATPAADATPALATGK